MDAEWKRKWVEALRSGKYRQGKEKLRDGRKFCCLGVLCDLVRKDGGRRWKKDGDTWMYYDDGGELPDEVLRTVRLRKKNPDAGPLTLAEHNDQGKSFTEIADLIEKHL